MEAHYLKVGDLLSLIIENNIPDDVAVCYHRIEDGYFDGWDISKLQGSKKGDKSKGWNTVKIKGDHYYNSVDFNEQLDRGKLVIDGKLDPDEVGEYYWHDKYKDQRKYIDLESEDLLDQYIEGFCCFYNKEKNILCITAHY